MGVCFFRVVQPVNPMELPILVAKPPNCHSLHCFRRMRATMRPTDNILEFAATKVLKLDTVVQHTKATLFTHFLDVEPPHKVRRTSQNLRVLSRD